MRIRAVTNLLQARAKFNNPLRVSFISGGITPSVRFSSGLTIPFQFQRKPLTQATYDFTAFNRSFCSELRSVRRDIASCNTNRFKENDDLTFAVHSGDIEEVRKYLSEEKGSVSGKLDRTTNPDMVKLLLEYGANSNQIINSRGDTALHIHCGYDVRSVEHLLEYGANVNARNKEGKTPLDYANSEDIIKILLAAKASAKHINIARSTQYKSPFNYGSNLAILKLIIAAGADVNAVDHTGRTLFDITDNPEIKKILSAARSQQSMAIKTAVTTITGLSIFSVSESKKDDLPPNMTEELRCKF